jgi:hypothetical protein
MMSYSINASEVRCYYPARKDPPRIPAAPPPAPCAVPAVAAHLPEPPVTPVPTAVPDKTDLSPGPGILTPGGTLGKTMHNGSVCSGELITGGGFTPVRLKQDSGI